MKRETENRLLPRPVWLRKRLPVAASCREVIELISDQNLHTVCQEAKCPNVWEYFSKKTAAFLIMGDRCTRNCRFCGVEYGPIGLPDPNEPQRLAEAAQRMNLKYVVVTSVTRDDLPLGGADFFVETIHALRHKISDVKVEVLIPDLQGNQKALLTVVQASPDVLNHNVETVPRLYRSVRPEADYSRSIELIKTAKFMDTTLLTKSGLMLGLGETDDEIKRVLEDLMGAGCGILTIGQYLQPTPKHFPVKRFVTPDEFEMWRTIGIEMGFWEVAAGPFVRSSYHAGETYQTAMEQTLRRSILKGE